MLRADAQLTQSLMRRRRETLGGYGYVTDSPISRIYTYARVEPIYGGTSRIRTTMIAKALR